jgi:O-antigen ligase
MAFQLSNFKLLYLFLLLGCLVGISVPYIGLMAIGFILVPLALIGMFKLQLNSRTTFFLIPALLYVNLLRPINGFKYISLVLDLFICFLILKQIIIRGITKRHFFFIFLITSFILLSFVQIFNPNIPSFSAGLEGFRKTCFGFILFYVGLFSYKSKLEIKKFLIGLSIISLPILLYGIKQYMFFSDFDKVFTNSNVADWSTGELFGKVRATSIFAGPFHFAMFASVCTIVNFWLISIVEKQKSKFYFFIFFLVSILACYCALVRTNLIALTVALILYIVLLSLKRSLFLVPYVGIILIILLNLVTEKMDYFINSDNELLRFIGTIANFSSDSRFVGRTEGWESLLFLINKQPILAYGTGSAGDTLDRVYSFQYHITSHNFFLKIFMETGLPGCILIVILFVGIIVSMIKKIIWEKDAFNKKLIACCFAILSIFLVSGTTGSAIEAYPSSGLIMLMLGISVSKLKELQLSETNVKEDVKE